MLLKRVSYVRKVISPYGASKYGITLPPKLVPEGTTHVELHPTPSGTIVLVPLRAEAAEPSVSQYPVTIVYGREGE